MSHDRAAAEHLLPAATRRRRVREQGRCRPPSRHRAGAARLPRVRVPAHHPRAARRATPRESQARAARHASDAPPPSARRRPWVVAEPDSVSGSWYPNLRAEIIPTGPNQLWVSDITYVRLERAFVFLAVVLDVFSRKVIGYAIGPTLDARLPLAALDAAIESRQPPPGCVHHSDRGSQYSSGRYRERLAEAGLLGSMSRAGNPYDNAHVESFMKTLKHE
nr:DDE-type integrase/transposase/recombinase [Gemmatimonas groenlandica]